MGKNVAVNEIAIVVVRVFDKRMSFQPGNHHEYVKYESREFLIDMETVAYCHAMWAY